MPKKKKIVVPDIKYKDGRSLFAINKTPEFPKYISGFINDANGWAGGSKAENVGQVSELIKEFREACPKGSINDWIDFHSSLEGENIQVLKGRGSYKHYETVQMAGVEQGVQDIMNKILEIKNNINLLTEDMVRSWLKNLVYEKTYCGLEAQEQILKSIAEKHSFEWILGSVEDEKQGIDGYIIDSNGPKFYPLQIKSSSYNIKNKQEHFVCPVVTYDLIEEGINYKMPNDALVEPKESDIWKEIRERTLARYNKR